VLALFISAGASLLPLQPVHGLSPPMARLTFRFLARCKVVVSVAICILVTASLFLEHFGDALNSC
jgi:hypothetical protein